MSSPTSPPTTPLSAPPPVSNLKIETPKPGETSKNLSAAAKPNTATPKSSKKRSKGQKSQSNVLSNKKVLKNFQKVQWRSNNQPELILNNVRILLKPEQINLLIEKQNQLRQMRMKQAKSRGNVLMKLTKTEKGYEQALQDAREKIEALVRGWRVRSHMATVRKSAIRIQNWWTKVLPAQKKFRTHLADKRRREMEQQSRKNEEEHILFVQHQLMHCFKHYLGRVREIREAAVHQCFNYLEAMKARRETLEMRDHVVSVQSGIRAILSHFEGSDDFIQVKAQHLKRHVLELYQKWAVPYPRRALFCFRTRAMDRETFVYAHRELQAMSQLREPLLTPEAFRKHLSHILKTLYAHEYDMDFIKIIRTVYQPQIVFHKKKKMKIYNYRFDGRKPPQPNWLLAKIIPSIKRQQEKKDQQENPLPPIPKEDHLRIEDPKDSTNKLILRADLVPFGLVMKELVKNLFNPNASLKRSDWSAALIFRYVMGEEIKNVSSVVGEAMGVEEPVAAKVSLEKGESLRRTQSMTQVADNKN